MTIPDVNWIREAPGEVQRIEASFRGNAFAPHRHDTYAIGITIEGVQTFDYRGATRHSLPGKVVVLHPDEKHDGRAGTDEAFRYRTLYVQPSDIQAVIEGLPLPFIKAGTSDDPRLRVAVTRLLADYERPLEELEYQDGFYELVMAMTALAGTPKKLSPQNYKAAKIARDYLADHLDQNVTMKALEAATGRERWALSRDFRSVFGTSPYRYLILRRLEQGQLMIRDGEPLADTAFACGFADQSHFGRHFKKAFGITPDDWRTIVLA